MHARHVMALVLAVTTAAAARAADPAPGTPDAPAQKVTWDTLAAELDSGDAARRDAAIGFIDKAPYSRRDALEALLGTVQSPSGHAAIERHLVDIYQLLANDPPAISLHVKNADLHQVLDALNEEMGTHMSWGNGVNAGGARYTLDVDKKPFWEVIALLYKQGKFAVSPLNDYTFNAGREMEAYAIKGPFIMYASTSDLTNPVSTPPSFMVNFTVVADPRLPLLRLQVGKPLGTIGGSAELGPDSAGNVFTHLNGSSGNGGSASYGFIGYMQTYWPANPGKTITSLSASVSAVTLVPEATVIVRNVDTNVGWTGDLGKAHLKVMGFQEDLSRAPMTTVTPDFLIDPPELGDKVLFRVYDSDGHLRWSERGDTTGRTTGTIRGPEKRPYGVVATIGKQVYGLKADLEIKDLPMPRR